MCSQRELQSPHPPKMDEDEEQRQQGDGESPIPLDLSPRDPRLITSIGDAEREILLMRRLRQDPSTPSNLSIEELTFLVTRILPSLSLEHLNLLCRLLVQIYTI